MEEVCDIFYVVFGVVFNLIEDRLITGIPFWYIFELLKQLKCEEFRGLNRIKR